ncbi:MAG: porin [Flavobacterium sp. BFFFF2]|nr:MAG: porin [Flavobacterium sp. BFFFF2]
MSHLKKTLFLLFLLLSVVEFSSAQEIILGKYRFGEGLYFTGKDDNYQIKVSGYLQPNVESKKYLDTDDATLYNRFRMRRARFEITGEAKKEKISYQLELDLTGGGEGADAIGGLVYDAWIGYNISKRTKITFGQKSTPTDNRELGMSSGTLQLADRSPVSAAFASVREFGLFFETRYKITRKSILLPALAITNGDGINVTDKDHGGLKYGGRIDYLPFGQFSNLGQYRQADLMRESTPKFVIGAHYSYNVGISDRRGSQSGTILYLDKDNNELLPDYVKYGVDFLFKYNGFSLLGEYVNASARVPGDITQRVRTDGSTSTNFDVNGLRDVENYIKGRMMVGEGYNIQGGYVFKNLFSIDARVSYLKPESYSFLNNPTFYNRSNYYTLGISKYISKGYGAKIQLDCTYINAKDGSNDLNGNPIKGNEFVTRLVTTIAF